MLVKVNRSIIPLVAIILLTITIYSPVSAKELTLTNHLDTNLLQNRFVYGQINNNSKQWNPAVYDDRVVWKKTLIDYQNGDIYLYNFNTSIENRITASGSADKPAIYGDRIVWEDWRRGAVWENDHSVRFIHDVYMYNISTSKETQITTSGSAGHPAIYGDKIVWVDSRRGGQIYMYDISTSKETLISTSGKAYSPAIYGDKIVWEDRRSGYNNNTIYMYNISTSKETQISTSGKANNPAIYGDKIVWVDRRSGYYNNNIYIYNISTSKETQITTSGSVGNPAIYGDRIVWTDSQKVSDIYNYNISTSEEIPINTSKLSPTVLGRNGTGEIYVYTSSMNLDGSKNLKNNLSFVIFGPEGKYTGNGSYWAKLDAPKGTYTIRYGSVSGYDIPTPETKILKEGDSIKFYTTNFPKKKHDFGWIIPFHKGMSKLLEKPSEGIGEGGTGKINVKAERPWKPDSNFSSKAATFTISGPKTYSGNGSYWEKDVPAGTYTINYGPVSGYKTPPSETKILTAGDSINFIGSYNYTLKKKVGESLDYGGFYKDVMLIKQIDPEKNEVLMEFATKDSSKSQNLFSNNRKVGENETGEIYILTGIASKPDSYFSSKAATFTISGPETYSGNGSYWKKIDAPAGTYTINYGPVSGYETPASETKKLNAGNSIIFFGSYNYTLKKKVGESFDFGYEDAIQIKQINPEKNEVLMELGVRVHEVVDVFTELWKPGLNFSVENAAFTILGPETYSGNGSHWVKRDAPVGIYTITYGPVSGYETPASETKKLNAGGYISFHGIYTLIKKVGDSIDFGDGYVVLIKQIDPKKNEVLMELQLYGHIFDEKIAKENDSYVFSKYGEEGECFHSITPVHISLDARGEYTDIYISGFCYTALVPHSSISIISKPEGANVTLIGEKYRGDTPRNIPAGKTPTDIKVGDVKTHTIRLELQGYNSWEGEFQFNTLEEPQKMEVSLNKT